MITAIFFVVVVVPAIGVAYSTYMSLTHEDRLAADIKRYHKN